MLNNGHQNEEKFSEILEMKFVLFVYAAINDTSLI